MGNVDDELKSQLIEIVTSHVVLIGDSKVVNGYPIDLVNEIFELFDRLATKRAVEARIDEARKAKQIATNHFDATGFTIATIFSERIAQLSPSDTKGAEK